MPRETMFNFFTKCVKWSKSQQSAEAYDLIGIDWASYTEKDAIKIFDESDFLYDSSFMEHAYLIDFDSPGTQLIVLAGLGRKASPGWEIFRSKEHNTYTNYCGTIDLTLPKEVAYILMHGMTYNRKRRGLLTRCRQLVKAPLGDVVRECSMTEKYDMYPRADNRYSLQETAGMLDDYLKYRLTHPGVAEAV